jgi:hypothetical protein
MVKTDGSRSSSFADEPKRAKERNSFASLKDPFDGIALHCDPILLLAAPS